MEFKDASLTTRPAGVHELTVRVSQQPRKFLGITFGTKQTYAKRDVLIHWTWIGLTLNGEIIVPEGHSWVIVPLDKLDDINVEFLKEKVLGPLLG